MNFICSFFLLAGRICLSAIFFLAAFHKLMDYDGTVQFMASKNMQAIPFFLFTAVAVELLGGFSLVFGYKTRFGAILLLLFLIPATSIFHDFWNIEDAKEMQLQTIHFFSNLGIFGGLLYVLCCGPGKWSIDGKGCCE
ncbi:MAG: Inner membrane protein YphA [Chlamydiae bacterium]|nr:Inner membrane protein YphA [Chlamydiota bacterium]